VKLQLLPAIRQTLVKSSFSKIAAAHSSC